MAKPNYNEKMQLSKSKFLVWCVSQNERRDDDFDKQANDRLLSKIVSDVTDIVTVHRPLLRNK